jgi:hypothetical protein
MKFSWKGLILAPLVVPVVFAALLTMASPGKGPLIGFVLIAALASIISYPTTIFLLLPSLYVMSKTITLRWYWVGLVGLVLGVFIFFPVTWMEFKSSGPDSGPPQGTFWEFLWRSDSDPMFWLFPVAGMVTAMAYWLLGSVRPWRAKAG